MLRAIRKVEISTRTSGKCSATRTVVRIQDIYDTMHRRTLGEQVR